MSSMTVLAFPRDSMMLHFFFLLPLIPLINDASLLIVN
jgi:hypothetical protein